MYRPVRIKLDKKQLHYRLSAGKDLSRVEQDVGVGDAYARGFENMLTVYTKPETEQIPSQDDKRVDALSYGQMFRGVVYGSACPREAWARSGPTAIPGCLHRSRRAASRAPL